LVCHTKGTHYKGVKKKDAKEDIWAKREEVRSGWENCAMRTS
jgi:hypothetical protein